jgi:antitoxin VapB
MAYHTSLNLKSDEAYRLARELSERTGESMTAAVVVALQERLDRLSRETKQSRVERILAIGRAYAAELTDAERAIDHDKLLYNEMGLPRDC